MKSSIFFALILIVSGASYAATDLKVTLDSPDPLTWQIKKATILPLTAAGKTLLGGEKPPAMFYDTVEVAYEKGVANTHFSKYLPSDPVSKNQTLYDPKSPWGNAAGTLYVLNTPENARHKRADKYWFGSTGTSNLQAPRVYNKDTPWATNEPKKLYVSWWYKQQNDTRDYFAFQLINVSEGFNPKEGEEFSVAVEKDSTGSTVVYGRVIQYDAATATLTGNFYGQKNSNRVKGRVLTLNVSKTTATLNTMVNWQGSNKYIRVWESDGANPAMRMSWTNTAIYVGDMIGYPSSPVIAREWNHMELFIDQVAKKVSTKVNGNVDYVGVYTEDQDKAGFAPAIGLIGFDPSAEAMNQIWMDDIYADSSFRRITLSNEPRYTEGMHEEIQYYTSWTADKIEFIPSIGGLIAKDKAVYAYIYSDNNVPNSEGILVPQPSF